MLLESGGFGLIALDLSDLPPQTARRIPLTTWFRFRRAVEHTPTVLLSVEQQPIAGSCSSLLLKLEGASKLLAESVAKENMEESNSLTGGNREAREQQASEGRKNNLNQQTDLHFPYPTHAQLLTGLGITVELMRSRLQRKPIRAATMAFASKTAWAG
jgi:hypothetical protein